MAILLFGRWQEKKLRYSFVEPSFNRLHGDSFIWTTQL